jgi:hypothetical protein
MLRLYQLRAAFGAGLEGRGWFRKQRLPAKRQKLPPLRGKMAAQLNRQRLSDEHLKIERTVQ